MAEPASRRRCVLIAEGRTPVPHTPIFTLRPYERTVLAFLRAGIREFVVAGDPGEAHKIREALASGPCRRAKVRISDTLAVTMKDDDVFFVVRADCHYDRRLIVRFVEETRSAASARAAVDFRPDALASHEGAPRVALWVGGGDDAPLRMCADALVGADAVLAGLALVTPAFGRIFDEEKMDGRALPRALSTLASREPVAPWPVAELWHQLRAEDDTAMARRKVLAGAVGVSDGVVARYVNRPISRRITERLLSRNVKPWQLTVASFLGTLAAGLSFAMGHAVTGGMLAQTASVLDGVDGELARIRYQDSPFSGVYDAFLDRVGDAVLFGGMTLYAWLMGAGASAIAVGFGAVAGSSLSMLVKEKYAAQFGHRYADEREGRVRWLLLGRDGRLFLALVAGVTGYVEIVLAYLAVGTHLLAGVRIYRIRSEVAAA